tara:strand:- start:1137 stop:1712 length:576 start_codon:yes stop_codon:yes gene_type:complete
MTIEGDSVEYELLRKWTLELPLPENPKHVTTAEIGVRRGLGSKIIMMAMQMKLKDIPYHHIAIDPYNNLSYVHFDNQEPITANYDDKMKKEMLEDFKDEKNFLFFHMTDREFMNRFSKEELIYDLVHFDGPHTTVDVLREAVWFADRSRVGTRFVFDDYKYYQMKSVYQALHWWDFKVLEKGDHKICLQKV